MLFLCLNGAHHILEVVLVVLHLLVSAVEALMGTYKNHHWLVSVCVLQVMSDLEFSVLVKLLCELRHCFIVIGGICVGCAAEWSGQARGNLSEVLLRGSLIKMDIKVWHFHINFVLILFL